jgi:DNA-binding CsgD family transcriptional regulator
MRRGESLAAITVDAGLSSEQVVRALRHLQSLGLLGTVLPESGSVLPVAPDVAIERLLQHKQVSLLAQQHQLLQVREQLEELTGAFQREWQLTDPGGSVQLLVGDEVRSHVASLAICAEHDFAAFVDGPDDDTAGLPADPPPAGVRHRTLYSRGSLSVPRLAAQAEQAASRGEEARVTASLPLRLLLVDDRLALVPLAPVATSGSLLLRSPLVIGALWELFESAWQRAVPISSSTQEPRHDDSVSDEDRILLQLMAAGLKDEAIARRLGVAERTVGRRIGALMLELNAETRFQAGMQAARRGLLA